MIKTWQYTNRRKHKKALKVFKKFLERKHTAEVYKFTTELHAEPVYKIAGFKIAIERGVYLGKDCIFYSFIV